jgi:hypothetical protein
LKCRSRKTAGVRASSVSKTFARLVGWFGWLISPLPLMLMGSVYWPWLRRFPILFRSQPDRSIPWTMLLCITSDDLI